jgi:hypothetical protein
LTSSSVFLADADDVGVATAMTDEVVT